jgi:TRAP-type C4-dicarboxylate transport system substrate-binding protein
MQTGMIDTYWATSALAAALQWHRTSKFVSAQGLGFINGAVLFRRAAWDALPDEAKKAMADIVDERAKEDQLDIRKTDDRVFKRLLKRGYTGVDATNPAEWWDAGRELRKRLIGRVYTQALVDKAEKIALKFADKEQLAYWKK